jgi:hypothetical protein
MTGSRHVIRRKPIALSMVAVAWLVTLSAESVGPLQRDSVPSNPWTIHPTDHFDIYYRQEQASRLSEVAREAERAYLRVSVDLQHTLAKKVPLILLQMNRDLPKNSWQAHAVIRASGAPDGVDHVLLSLESFSARVTHELTHEFEFDMLPRPCRVPPWVLEGLADHENGSWISSDRSTVRASVAAGVIPAVANLADGDRLWGHAVFDFVASEYGTQGLRQFLMAQCDRPAGGADAGRVALDLSSKEFDRAFVRYVRAQFEDR